MMSANTPDTLLASLASLENQILLCCARTRLEPHHEERARLLLRQGVDYDELFRAAQRHRMVPLLFWHLNATVADVIPEDRLDTLRSSFIENAGWVLQLTRELLTIVKLFEEHGITVVPYKGPALAAQLYGNIALRQVGDLDILVRRTDVETARALLLSLGYSSRDSFSPAQKAFLLRAYCNQVFDRVGGATVELHWRFMNPYFPFSLDLDSLSAPLERQQLGGASVAALPPEDLLLALCVHGSKHRWDRLEWICGVSELLRRAEQQLDWDNVRATAQEQKCGRMLRLGLYLSRHLLEGRVPSGVMRYVESDRRVPILAAQVAHLHSTEGRSGVFGKLPQRIFQFRSMDGTRNRVRFLAHEFTTSNDVQSWRFLVVGRRDIPLQPPIRAFQIAWKLATRVFRQLSSNLRREP